jgi:hypothetical protein
VPWANTAADPYDPTRRTNYADTKRDLVHLLRSPYGNHEIEQVYNTHNKQSTIAGGAATRTTVQNAPNTTQHLGSIGQYRRTISPRSTGQNDSTDHKTRMERINKRLQEIDLTSAVERADTDAGIFSPAPSASTAALELESQAPIFKKIIHLLPLELICMRHITTFCRIFCRYFFRASRG